MSEQRKIELQFDLKEVEETAKTLGWATQRSVVCKTYRGSKIVDLVVYPSGSSYSIGFTHQIPAGKVEMLYDSDKKSYTDKLVTAHYERVINKRLRAKGMRVHKRIDEAGKVHLMVRRG